MASQSETRPRMAPRAGLESKCGRQQRFKIKTSQETQAFQPKLSKISGCRDLPAGTQLELALSYARAGWLVSPVSPDKRSLTPHGFKDATIDVATIVGWWTRWPPALIAIPTGSRTGLWVLDIDPPAGLASLRDLLALLGLDSIDDLSPVVVETPSGGWHVWFSLHDGEQPRTRARDIGPGLDTRGEGGYCIAPGNVRPDRLAYCHVGARHDLAEAIPAPPELVYLTTFNARERDTIADDAELSRTIRAAKPTDWPSIFEAHRERERARIMTRLAASPPDGDAMRRQGLADLAEAANTYAALSDGRRNALFVAACRLAKYVAHSVLTEAEVLAAFEAAAIANGATAKYGRAWLAATIWRGLAYGANDPLPPLARIHREGSA